MFAIQVGQRQNAFIVTSRHLRYIFVQSNKLTDLRLLASTVRNVGPITHANQMIVVAVIDYRQSARHAAYRPPSKSK